MLVEETLPVVYQAPFAHDAAAAAYDAAETLVGEVYVVAADAGVDGEVVHALLTLFDECVAVDFPTQVFHLAIHLLQCLVDGHGAYGYGTVAHNPFPRLVDVVARGEVHQRVAAPLARPHGLVHLLLDAGGGGGVADVGVDLHGEVAADNHRFALWVVDVGGQHGSASSYLLSHKLGSDVAMDAQLLAVHVLADGHVFHLWGHDAGLGVCHLGDVLAGLGAAGQLDVLEAEGVEAVVGKALFAIFARYLGELLGVGSVENPLLAHSRQSLLQIHLIGRIAVGSAGVVDEDRGVGLRVRNAALVFHHGGGEVDLGHAYLDLWENLSLHIRLFSLGVGFVVVWHNLSEERRTKSE